MSDYESVYRETIQELGLLVSAIHQYRGVKAATGPDRIITHIVAFTGNKQYKFFFNYLRTEFTPVTRIKTWATEQMREQE